MKAFGGNVLSREKIVLDKRFDFWYNNDIL